MTTLHGLVKTLIAFCWLLFILWIMRRAVLYHRRRSAEALHQRYMRNLQIDEGDFETAVDIEQAIILDEAQVFEPGTPEHTAAQEAIKTAKKDTNR